MFIFFYLDTKENEPKEKIKAASLRLLRHDSPLSGKNSLRSNSFPLFTLRTAPPLYAFELMPIPFQVYCLAPFLGIIFVGADRRVRPIARWWMDARSKQMDGEAVQQLLTAVWRGMRHLRRCGGRGGRDLEEVESRQALQTVPCEGTGAWAFIYLIYNIIYLCPCAGPFDVFYVDYRNFYIRHSFSYIRHRNF